MILHNRLSCWVLATNLLVALLLVVAFLSASAASALVPDEVNTATESPLEKARLGGKYATLLRQIEVPADREQYSYFREYGYWEGSEYAGHKFLPKGYWVYVYPHWYIWRDCIEKP